MAETDTTITSARRAGWLWWGLAALSLLLGYADLIRGGITLAPILLVLGYCVFVPVAILRRSQEGPVAAAAAGARPRRGE